jgi:3-(3-hydroxy-phenyl)propionate hydroxylase
MQLLKDDVEHPFRLQCEQWKMTELILRQLKTLSNVRIHFNAQVKDVLQDQQRVQLTVTHEHTEITHQGDYLIAADGAWSVIRQLLQIEFEGFTYPERFLVLSTEFEYADHLPNLSYVNYCSDPKEWCVLLRVPSLWRVLFPTRVDESDEEVMSENSVQGRLQHLLNRSQDYVTVHRTLYKVHQRVAKTFRQNRVFLAGDCAHINNPLGGMGMNGGIHDAHNLCHKLIDVLLNGLDESHLDRYERQRRTIAIEYINSNTARNKKLLEETDPVIRKNNQLELTKIAQNSKLAREYLLKTSMIDALERAEAII